MYRDAGVDVVGFTGVPVFQAEGLVVKTNKTRYTPLFLDKVPLVALHLGTSLHPPARGALLWIPGFWKFWNSRVPKGAWQNSGEL